MKAVILLRRVSISALFCGALLASFSLSVAAAPALITILDTNTVTGIELTISEAHWDELRYQHREAEFFPEEAKPAPGDPYTWFPAEIRINGTNFAHCEIRKKGYIGSNDIRRPGLKVRTLRRPASPSVSERESDSNVAPNTPSLDLTLNNNRQDPSFIRQYLAYELFRRAGVPAPGCSFVRLKLNGKDLGIYTCVEPINRAFLEANFGNASGNLYEGGRSDFRSNWVQNFAIKKSAAGNGRSDLVRATVALEQSKGSLLPVLEDHFEIDAFFRFWAVESLLNTSDGYAANMNNFYLYNNPSTSRFMFIPWGADSTLHFGRPLNSVPGDPQSVIGTGILAYRLYNSPEGAAKYRATLRDVLKTAWKEEVLLREVDRLESLLAPFLEQRTSSFSASVENVRRFIRTRRAAITPELDGPAPPLKSRPLELAKRRNVGRFTGKFSVNLNRGRSDDQSNKSNPSTTRVTLTGTLWNEPLAFRQVTVEIQMPPELPDNNPYAERRIPIVFMASTPHEQQYVVYLAVDSDSFVTSRPIPINNTHIVGFCGTRERNLGMLRGSLLLTAVPKNGDGLLSGEFTAELFSKRPKP